MAALVYQVFSSSAMVSMGLYHLISTTKNHLKSPRDYFAKPHHPFSSTPSSISFYQRLIGKNLQLYLIILCLLIAFFHQTLISSDFDPLLKGHTPVYRFTTLQSAAVLFLLLILSIVLLSKITSLLPFPPDLFFGVASGIFFLQYSVSSSSSSLQISNLQAKCDSVSGRIFHSLPGPHLPSAALCGGRWPWGLNVTAGIMGIADWTLPVLNVNRFLKKPDGDDECSDGIPVTRFTLQSIYAQSDDEKLQFEYESGNTNILVELFKHLHLLLLQVRDSTYKLPGGRLRPGESDIDGLRRKLSNKLSEHCDGTGSDWEVENASASGGDLTLKHCFIRTCRLI